MLGPVTGRQWARHTAVARCYSLAGSGAVQTGHVCVALNCANAMRPRAYVYDID